MKYNPKIHHRRSIRLKSGIRQGIPQIFCKAIRNTLTDHFLRFFINHMHGIIILTDAGATLAVAPNAVAPNAVAPNAVAPNAVAPNYAQNDADDTDNRARVNRAPTIGDIVGAYKSLVANGCLEIYKTRNEMMGKLWQRNYHEHIIRNEQSYQNIARYIINNPANWKGDKFNQA